MRCEIEIFEGAKKSFQKFLVTKNALGAFLFVLTMLLRRQIMSLKELY